MKALARRSAFDLDCGQLRDSVFLWVQPGRLDRHCDTPHVSSLDCVSIATPKAVSLLRKSREPPLKENIEPYMSLQVGRLVRRRVRHLVSIRVPIRPRLCGLAVEEDRDRHAWIRNRAG